MELKKKKEIVKKTNKTVNGGTPKLLKKTKNLGVIEPTLTHDEIATIKLHHAEKPQFCSLYYLINDGHGIGQLASAIENHGVWGWDRYGRYKHFKNVTGKANISSSLDKALDSLASVQEDLRSARANELFVISKFLEIPNHPIHFFGWLENELPEIEKTNEGVNWEQGYDSELLVKNSTLLLIGLLLQFIKGNNKWPRHPKYESQEQLANEIFQYAYALEKGGKIKSWGLRSSSVEKVFAEANKLLK